MEPYEATRIVYSRVQSLDPDNVSKIMGILLLQDNGEQEMFRLAVGSDSLLQSIVMRAKKELGLSSKGHLHLPHQLTYLQIPSLPSNGGHFSPQMSSRLSPQLAQFSPKNASLSFNQLSPQFHTQMQQIQRANHALDPFHVHMNSPRPDDQRCCGQEHKIAAIKEQLPLQYLKQMPRLKGKQTYQHDHQQLLLQDLPAVPLTNNTLDALTSTGGGCFRNHEQYHHDTMAFLNDSSRIAAADRGVIDHHPLNDLPSPDIVWKPCLYFSRGYCKHGNDCRFFHSPYIASKDRSGLLSPMNGQWPDQIQRSDEYFVGASAGSLEKLELELQEILRGRRSPVSIASLPQLYYERFGKTLQAEGYLTESQRHGKVGHSLTRLLARLRTTVSLIDRPHGQHAIVLAEDAHKFAFNPRSYSADDINPCSRQIYLTFPAESTFSEEDVSLHFRAYGPVQDVRIPFQQKRMFGFVTFVYSEAVRTILSEGNPHYICGARVLVKPYREKGKTGDKKLLERGELSPSILKATISSSRFSNENDVPSMQMDEQSLQLELERRRFTEMQIAHMERWRVEAEMAAANSSSTPQPSQNHSSIPDFPADDLTISAEEIRHMRSNSAFSFLFDVLDHDANDNALKAETYSSGLERNSVLLPNNLSIASTDTSEALAYNLSEEIHRLHLAEDTGSSNIATPSSGLSSHEEHNSKVTDGGRNERAVQ